MPKKLSAIRRRLERLVNDLDEGSDGLIDPRTSTDAELEARIVHGLTILGASPTWFDPDEKPWRFFRVSALMDGWRGTDWSDSELSEHFDAVLKATPGESLDEANARR